MSLKQSEAIQWETWRPRFLTLTSDSILGYVLFLFFKFYMYKCFVCLCVDVPQMCRVPKKGAEFPELELQVAVNCQMSAGN